MIRQTCWTPCILLKGWNNGLWAEKVNRQSGLALHALEMSREEMYGKGSFSVTGDLYHVLPGRDRRLSRVSCCLKARICCWSPSADEFETKSHYFGWDASLFVKEVLTNFVGRLPFMEKMNSSCSGIARNTVWYGFGYRNSGIRHLFSLILSTPYRTGRTDGLCSSKNPISPSLFERQRRYKSIWISHRKIRNRTNFCLPFTVRRSAGSKLKGPSDKWSMSLADWLVLFLFHNHTVGCQIPGAVYTVHS